MGILLTLVALSFVIFVHEMGHLIFAKRGGIGVSEFSVGMGLKLWGFKWGETTYNLRLFPLGGYVKLAGLDEDAKGLDEASYYQNRPLKDRFFTIVAGSFMNLVLGFIVFYIVLFFSGYTELSPLIKKVIPGSPANEVMLQAGDSIVSINGKQIFDVKKDFIDVIHQSSDAINLEYKRGSETYTVSVTPQFNEEHRYYFIGVELGYVQKESGIIKSFSIAIDRVMNSAMMVFYSFKLLFSGQASVNDLSGPIGIVQYASLQLSENVIAFFNVMAMISVALGFINLMPIPVLDGGHLMMLLYEFLFKRPVPKKVEIIMNNIFALLLIGLMCFVIFNDIRFWSDRNQIMEEVLQSNDKD